MNGKDLIDGIRNVVREELMPIKKTLDDHTRKITGLTEQLADVSETVTEILESHSVKIEEIENQIGISSVTD